MNKQLNYSVREDIFKLYNEEKQSVEQIRIKYPDIPKRTIYYHTEHAPKPRKQSPEPMPHQISQNNYYREQPIIDIRPERITVIQKNKSGRELPARDEYGRFLPRGNESTAIVKRETLKTIQHTQPNFISAERIANIYLERTQYKPVNLYAVTLLSDTITNGINWLGQKIFNNDSQKTKTTKLLKSGSMSNNPRSHSQPTKQEQRAPAYYQSPGNIRHVSAPAGYCPICGSNQTFFNHCVDCGAFDI